MLKMLKRLFGGGFADTIPVTITDEFKTSLRDALETAWTSSCKVPVGPLDNVLQDLVGRKPIRLQVLSAEVFVMLLRGSRIPMSQINVFDKSFDESIVKAICGALAAGKQVAMGPADPQGFAVIVGHFFE